MRDPQTAGGRPFRARLNEVPERGHALIVLRTPPRIVSTKPQRMLTMPRARGPRGVDERIMNVGLDQRHQVVGTAHVAERAIALDEPGRFVTSRSPECGLDIAKQEVHDSPGCHRRTPKVACRSSELTGAGVADVVAWCCIVGSR